MAATPNFIRAGLDNAFQPAAVVFSQALTTKQINSVVQAMSNYNEYLPRHVIYNGTTTICVWHDGTKTIARPQNGERFDKETGLAMCIAKKLYGSRSKFLKAVEDGDDQNSRLTPNE